MTAPAPSLGPVVDLADRSRFREVINHSHEWETLVETGWKTLSVDGRIATMIYAPAPRW